MTTLPAERDRLLQEFPELVQFALPAVRLHPRPGSPTANDSSVGGPLLWPRDEPWPTCQLEHLRPGNLDLIGDDADHQRRMAADGLRFLEQRFEELGRPPVMTPLLEKQRSKVAELGPVSGDPLTIRASMEQPTQPVVMVSAVQLFAHDAPGYPFPEGHDLLQVLWCSEMHATACPEAKVYWRKASRVVSPRETNPATNAFAETPSRFIPRACEVRPEVVVEYPPICNSTNDPVSLGVIPAGLEARIRVWDTQNSEDTGYSALAEAPGWKIGGWEESCAYPPPACFCGAQMRPILTVDPDGWPNQLWDPRSSADGELDGASHGPSASSDRNSSGVWIANSGKGWFRLCTADPTHPVIADTRS